MISNLQIQNIKNKVDVGIPPPKKQYWKYVVVHFNICNYYNCINYNYPVSFNPESAPMSYRKN